MFVIINALKSISRSKGRNILIGIIVVAIAAASCVALAIRNTAHEAETAGGELLNITASITVDTQRIMEVAQRDGADMSSMQEMMSQYQNLSLPELMAYSESDYVKNFYYSSSISLNASGDLEAYGTDDSSGSNFSGGMGRQGGMLMGGMAMGDFTVTGYSAEDAMTKFVNGTSKIADGDMFDISSTDMNCLISYELALYNGLSVGDTITLTNPNVEEETYTFTITGIYTDSSSSESSNIPRFSTAMDPANSIYISYDALQTIVEHSASVAVTETNANGFEISTTINGQLSSTFVFSSHEDYENFGEELSTMGLSEYYTLSSSDISNYEAGLVPLQNLSRFAVTLLFIVLAIGGVILIVINVFNIRERKYEVGVLTAMGIKKGKVAMQFVTELLFVTLIAIVIGAGVGAAVSVPVSNNLLAVQIEQIQSQQANQETNFGRVPGGTAGGRENLQGGRNSIIDIFNGNRSDVNYLDQINATVNFSILGQLIGIGIILTLISSFAAVVFVMRYEPLKILANRT
ncbi:ABC transporter permease [Alkalicella caledoniensis]|uniref:ABC transporter permease n=1 Tax=Alkalicella caledoniensis TaxID=2731377 RepID=A0A7G9W6L6_ALKCA|nr:ABC transporter permease [Alkalicella caledoniensis]QNO14328.1 ABC transporter permease [Alkalicella caledoniensis]